MAIMFLLCCAVILSCIITNRFSSKFGMPALLCFMALGMVFGSDGLYKFSCLRLLSFPHLLPELLFPSLFIALFLTFLARPVAVFLILLPFGSSLRQCLLVSWSSLRGAASIVFAIILSVPSFREEHDGKLKEILVEPGHNW